MNTKKILVFAGLLLSLVSATLIILNGKKAIASTGQPAKQQISYMLGDAVEDFALPNTKGEKIGLASNPTAKGYILVFTCNSCPYAQKYQARLVQLHAKYQGLGYPVLAINPNSVAGADDESPAANVATAKAKGFEFDYLADTTQEQAKAFGAKKTPSVFIVQKVAEKYILKYIGAIDDNPQSQADVTSKYVENAMGELLLGKTISVNNTKSIGCGIKWIQ
jgi:peroxiredoxin